MGEPVKILMPFLTSEPPDNWDGREFSYTIKAHIDNTLYDPFRKVYL